MSDLTQWNVKQQIHHTNDPLSQTILFINKQKIYSANELF